MRTSKRPVENVIDLERLARELLDAVLGWHVEVNAKNGQIVRTPGAYARILEGLHQVADATESEVSKDRTDA